jgi:hypothetical protein
MFTACPFSHRSCRRANSSFTKGLEHDSRTVTEQMISSGSGNIQALIKDSTNAQIVINERLRPNSWSRLFGR